ncbi:MAG: alanine racemase, partial [Syntrophales bacterium]|nr:alanine racemase [Syntrophales bacterium]
MKEEQYRSWVEVDLDHFTHNWNELRRLVGPSVQILQVVKADAYGHGAIEISNMALQNGASWLGVANADEGVQLRVSGITAPILILSPSMESEISDIIKYRLIPSVSDVHFARILQHKYMEVGISGPIHIEIDTGMGRGGTMYKEALRAIHEIARCPNLILEGIFTHLSSGEQINDYSREQGRLFLDLLKKLRREGLTFPIRHMANSGGILNYPAFHFDLVRPGLMTYGIYPSRDTQDRARLEPVMSFKTRVALVKKFPRGYSIGYGRSYVTNRPTLIATIPVGYGDGYGVILSNRGEALIRGKRAPVVGRISMDMCTIDVSHIPDCQVGDVVTLMGKDGLEEITANDIAARVSTISYEILCMLGKRAPRIFIHKGQTGAVEPRLRRIYIPEEEKSLSRIDNIIRQCFQTRAKNEELGDAIYYEMFETLFGKGDRQLELRTDFRYDIKIADFTAGERMADPEAGEYFKVTTHIEYIKAIRSEIFFIGCARNNEQLAALFHDPRCEYRWLFSRGDSQVTDRDFRIVQVAVDGETIPLIRSTHTDRGYEVWCGGDILKEKVNRPVKLEIEIVTKKAKDNNTFSVYLVYPTRGLDITFDYRDTKLQNVREVAFFAGKNPYPEVVKERGKSIELKIDSREWIFPNSGVTFIW